MHLLVHLAQASSGRLGYTDTNLESRCYNDGVFAGQQAQKTGAVEAIPTVPAHCQGGSVYPKATSSYRNGYQTGVLSEQNAAAARDSERMYGVLKVVGVLAAVGVAGVVAKKQGWI